MWRTSLEGAQYFDPEAVRYAIKDADNERSRETLIYMSPADFLRIALPGADDQKQGRTDALLAQGVPFHSMLRLMVDESGRAWGHEGRHRARSLQRAGVKRIPVRFLSRRIRWGQPDQEYPAFLVSEDGFQRIPFPDSLAFPRQAKPKANMRRNRAQSFIAMVLAEVRSELSPGMLSRFDDSYAALYRYAEDQFKQSIGSSQPAPRTALLYDATGRRYRVRYVALPTNTQGTGVVRASNTSNFHDTKGYPVVFQARSLKRQGEKQKIEKIAQNLDPDRLLLPHSDPTFGAPVVWRGNGEKGTSPDLYYVLGGNSRTLAFLLADDERYAAYAERAQQLWPTVWPKEPPPPGERYLITRLVYSDDCPSIQDAAELTENCQIGFDQAQALAGATQQSMSGRETPLGEALSLVRALGVEDLAADIPAFQWAGIVARDNVGDFREQSGNTAFLSTIRKRLGSERFDSYMSDPDNAAKLINSVLIGFLPREIIDNGFASEREERAMMAALPIFVTLAMQEKNKEIPAGWSLLPHLRDAQIFAEAIRNLSFAQILSELDRMRRQELLTLKAPDGTPISLLADRVTPLGVLLALTLKRAKDLRDPATGVEQVLTPYAKEALRSADIYPPRAMSMFGPPKTMPPQYPAETLGLALAEARSGPGAAPIIVQTRSSTRTNYGRR